MKHPAPKGATLADRRKPCAVCGWGPSRSVHLPVISGPRKGQPYSHAWVSADTPERAVALAVIAAAEKGVLG